MTKKTESKELTVQNKKDKKNKKELTVQKKAAKKTQVKLPKIFKKTFTEKQLQRRLLKKIYVTADKKFVQDLYKEAGENKRGVKLYAIPPETLVEKKEQNRLITIARDIRTQKGRVRIIPLAAVLTTIAAIVFLFLTFKNRVIKNFLVDTCESIFEAKCDIDSVNFRLLDASLKIHHVQIANKNEPMKNLFECDRIALDFDLTSLLRSRFVTDELAISGMNTNTNRTYSGDISAKIAAKKKAQAEKEDSAFMKFVKERSNAALDSMKSSFQGVFDEYNPVNIIDNCYKNLKTPDVAKTTADETLLLIDEYKNKPQEIQEKLKVIQEAYDKVRSINIEELKKNPAQIPEVIKTIESLKIDAENLKKEADALVNDVKDDFNKTQTMAKNLQTAVTADTDMIKKEVNKITSINIADGQRFISNTLEGASYQLMGEYYPYIKQVTDYLEEQKAKKEARGPTFDEKLKSYIGKRAKGTDIYYRALPPKVWIKKLTVDGFNFSLNMTHISSDMDYVGKPATGVFKIGINNIDHTGTVVVDTRTKTENPLVLIDYNCDKLPLNIDKSLFGAQNIPGVPSINTNSNLDLALAIYEKDGFKITGTGIFNNMILTAQGFEPEWISNIYLNTLSYINEMQFQASCGYRKTTGLIFDLSTDIDKQFMNAFKKELMNQLYTLKTWAEEELNKKIGEWTGGAVTNIGTFEEIYDKLKNFDKTAEQLSKQIESKLNEIKIATEAKINEAVENAKEETKKQAEAAVENAKEEAKKQAVDYLQGLLKH